MSRRPRSVENVSLIERVLQWSFFLQKSTCSQLISINVRLYFPSYNSENIKEKKTSIRRSNCSLTKRHYNLITTKMSRIMLQQYSRIHALLWRLSSRLSFFPSDPKHNSPRLAASQDCSFQSCRIRAALMHGTVTFVLNLSNLTGAQSITIPFTNSYMPHLTLQSSQLYPL